MSEMTYTGVLTVMICGECHIQFAMPRDKYTRCHQVGEDWYCPNGHCRVFTTTEVMRLQKQLADEQENTQYYAKRLDEVYNEKRTVEKSLSAKKGQLTKLKKRVANGACPCCNRHFSDLYRHIQSQHPDYVQ